MPRPPLASADAIATALAIADLHRDELPEDDEQPDAELVLAAVMASVGLPYEPSA